MRSLVWFRRDLRVNDNSALHHAVKQSQEGVVGLFLFSPQQWKEHDDAELKIKFWYDNLKELSQQLSALNIPLIVRRCEHFDDATDAVLGVAKETNCADVFLNREYEVNELRRDRAVKIACDSAGLGCHLFHDRVIVPPQEITTKDGRFYSVFTPYRKVWDTKSQDFAKTFSKPRPAASIDVSSSGLSDFQNAFDYSDSTRQQIKNWAPGESEAAKRLSDFERVMSNYDSARDIPSLEGTSQLSPYLAAGVISPRQAFAAALKREHGPSGGDDGTKVWVSELTWRDFYAHVMVGFPRVSKHQPFKEKTDALQWRSDTKDFEAWKTGQTGYPIVDAGMRQLNQTGWMHNRLRMVTAMFLTKNLLIDWRWGEAYFMRKLIDGDLAANNGGWQWSASTGTDAVPYFRIFSPFSQSKRFDPDGLFIKKYCPELAAVPAKALHDLKKLTAAITKAKASYPDYVVDYSMSRERALKAFKSLND